MPVLKCPMGDECNWEYPCDFDQDKSMEIIKMHFSARHSTQVAATSETSINKAPKMDRPVVDIGIDQEEWNLFLVRWEQFRIGSRITPDSAASNYFNAREYR